MRTSYTESDPERAAPSARGADVVASSERCPVCGAPMTGRKTSACSDKCRAAKSRKRRVPLPVTEAKEIQASLTAALNAVWDAKNTLDRYGG